jgi:hypothetical protein
MPNMCHETVIEPLNRPNILVTLRSPHPLRCYTALRYYAS